MSALLMLTMAFSPCDASGNKTEIIRSHLNTIYSEICMGSNGNMKNTGSMTSEQQRIIWGGVKNGVRQYLQDDVDVERVLRELSGNNDTRATGDEVRSNFFIKLTRNVCGNSHENKTDTMMRKLISMVNDTLHHGSQRDINYPPRTLSEIRRHMIVQMVHKKYQGSNVLREVSTEELVVDIVVSILVVGALFAICTSGAACFLVVEALATLA